MLPLLRLDFTGKPDAWTTCLSGLESAGRKRMSAMTQRAVLRLYLNPFDHFIKRELRCPAYLRYVDDFLLFADDKRTLWRWQAAINERLSAARLTIHPAAQPRPVTEGIPFLGFIVSPQRRRVKRRKVVYYRRKLARLLAAYHLGLLAWDQVRASLLGWINHVRYGNTVGLRRATVGAKVLCQTT